MIGVETKPHEDHLREMGIVSFKERRFRGACESSHQIYERILSGKRGSSFSAWPQRARRARGRNAQQKSQREGKNLILRAVH